MITIEDKIVQLEMLEREARAEVSARETMSSRTDSQLGRWRSDLSKTISETKGNNYLQELREYRDKVKSITMDIADLEQEFKEVEVNYREFRKPVIVE